MRPEGLSIVCMLVRGEGSRRNRRGCWGHAAGGMNRAGKIAAAAQSMARDRVQLRTTGVRLPSIALIKGKGSEGRSLHSPWPHPMGPRPLHTAHPSHPPMALTARPWELRKAYAVSWE